MYECSGPSPFITARATLSVPMRRGRARHTWPWCGGPARRSADPWAWSCHTTPTPHPLHTEGIKNEFQRLCLSGGKLFKLKNNLQIYDFRAAKVVQIWILINLNRTRIWAWYVFCSLLTRWLKKPQQTLFLFILKVLRHYHLGISFCFFLVLWGTKLIKRKYSQNSWSS